VSAALRGLVVALLGAAALLGLAGPSVAAAPPPAPGSALGLPPVVVQVTRIGEAGDLAPLVGGEVVLERWVRSARMPDAAPTLAAAFAAETDANGTARFSLEAPLGPGQSLRARARYRDVSWPGAEVDPTRPVQLVVAEVGGGPEELALDLHIVVQPTEGRINMSARAVVLNRSLRAVDVSGGDGLRFPLLLPLLFDDVVTWTVVPGNPDRARFRFERSPEIGRLAVERGEVVYRGVVPPGDSLTITVTYGVPYDSRQDYRLALRPPLDVERLLLQVVHARRIAPWVAPVGDFEPILRRRGDELERFLEVVEPPRRGELFELDVVRTPSDKVLVRALAVYGTLLLTFLFGVAVLAGLRSRGAVAAEPEAAGGEGPGRDARDG